MRNYGVDSIILGERIQTLLIINDMTCKQLANQMGISYKTLSVRLKGEKLFRISDIVKITTIFNMDEDMCCNVFFNPNFQQNQFIITITSPHMQAPIVYLLLIHCKF